jgi:hypothetical protein
MYNIPDAYSTFHPQRIRNLNMNLGHRTIGYASLNNQNLTHQFINEYFSDNGMMAPMMGAVPVTGAPVTIFDHIEIPTRNKKLTATKYISDFLKGRLATGDAPLGSPNSSDSTSKRQYDEQKSAMMSKSGLESNFSDVSYNPQNVSFTYINPQYGYNNHGVMMDPFSNYPVPNYVSTLTPHATINFTRNYPEFFNNYDFRKLEHGSASNNKKCSTLRSKEKTRSRVKSKSIDRILDERQSTSQSKLTKVQKQELIEESRNAVRKPHCKELKTSKHSLKENEPETATKKTEVKHDTFKEKHSERSAFKKFTDLLNNTARKSRSPRLSKNSTGSVVSSSNSSVISDKSNSCSIKKEESLSSNMNYSAKNQRPTTVHEDEKKNKTPSQNVSSSAVKTTEVSFTPPPAPPIDMSVFKPVVSSFLTLKKSTKMRIPIPDDTMTKTFDIVLDELKSKLARIRTSNENLTNIDNLLHKPVLNEKEQHLSDDSTKIKCASVSDCENLSDSKSVAKKFSCEAVKNDKLVLRHRERIIVNDATSSTNRISNASSGREELKELIFITKSDSSYVNDEYQNQESIMRSLNDRLSQASIQKQIFESNKMGK